MSPLVTSSCGLVSSKAVTWQLCGDSLGGPCCGMGRCEIGWALKVMVKSWPKKSCRNLDLVPALVGTAHRHNHRVSGQVFSFMGTKELLLWRPSPSSVPCISQAL